jgi:hypothetical protein
MNVAYGDVQVELGDIGVGKVHAAHAPLTQIMSIASDIWADIRRSEVASTDHAGNDRLLRELQTKYSEFAMSYPIPFRWMVQARAYEPKAFEKFLRTHAKMMYRDRSEFLAAQSEYLVLLYRSRNPRAGARQISQYRDRINKSLKQDDADFMEAQKAATEEVRLLDEKNDAKRRQRLLAHLRWSKLNEISSGRTT